MNKSIQMTFKRIESKYIIPTTILEDLQKDLMAFLVEDDFPTSTITNVYFDTPDFQVIRDSIAKRHKREKIRMRTYSLLDCHEGPAFLEIKSKDSQGIGHKNRLLADPKQILQLIQKGPAKDDRHQEQIISDVNELRKRYPDLEPRIFIYYNRLSLKNRKTGNTHAKDKVRITIDHNLIYRDFSVTDLDNKDGYPLLEEGYAIMEVKSGIHKPDWLVALLEQYGIQESSFSKYGTAYRKYCERLIEQKEESHA